LFPPRESQLHALDKSKPGCYSPESRSNPFPQPIKPFAAQVNDLIIQKKQHMQPKKQSKKITAKTKVKVSTAAKAKPASKTVKAKTSAAKPAKTPAKPVVTAKKSAPTAIPARREITTEIISARAYTLWDQAGRPQGRDMEYWLQAESQLKQETQALAA
jgi:hypothetical protein